MGTSWEQVETQAMTYIKNDLSLNHDLYNRLPVFYNRMAAYMRAAMPRFNRPPEMMTRLAQYAAPAFETFQFAPENDLAAGDDLGTFEELAGYDIASVGILGEDAVGTPTYTSVSATFDGETGTLTAGQAILADTTLIIDAYRSGSFRATLSDTEIDLLANCIYVAYEHRFDNNILERTSKIRDSSFTTVSEASMTQANTARLRLADEELNGRLRAYEQGVAYMHTINKISIG